MDWVYASDCEFISIGARTKDDIIKFVIIGNFVMIQKRMPGLVFEAIPESQLKSSIQFAYKQR